MTHYEVLREIGLTKVDVRCYTSLREQGPATAQGLSRRLKLPATNLYAALNRLTERGFLIKFKLTTQPVLFTARPPNQAIREYYMYQRRIVFQLCTELGLSLPPAAPPVLHSGN
jgi:HTH-type transcriptional regulator, sugar sensing transcriptional regulator